MWGRSVSSLAPKRRREKGEKGRGVRTWCSSWGSGGRHRLGSGSGAHHGGALSAVSCVEAEKRKGENGGEGGSVALGRGGRGGPDMALELGVWRPTPPRDSSDARRAQGWEKRGGPVGGGNKVVRAFWSVDVFLIIFIYFKF
jgi:hypothetical protein